MLDLACDLPFTGLSQVWRGEVGSLDVGGMLAQSHGAMGAGAMKPTFEHNMVGMRCFARKQFWK